MGTFRFVPLRPLRFLVHIQPTGAATARGVDTNIEISADNLSDLREKLAAELQPFGYLATLVGMRAEPDVPKA